VLQRARIELRVTLEDLDYDYSDDNNKKKTAQQQKITVSSTSDSTTTTDATTTLTSAKTVTSPLMSSIIIACYGLIEKTLSVLTQEPESPSHQEGGEAKSIAAPLVGFMDAEHLLKLRSILVESMSAVVFFLGDVLHRLDCLDDGDDDYRGADSSLMIEEERISLVIPSIRLFSQWLSEETSSFTKESEDLLPLMFSALKKKRFGDAVHPVALLLPALPTISSEKSGCQAILA